MIDSKTIKKGISFKDIRDSYVIFITEKDIFKRAYYLGYNFAQFCYHFFARMQYK